MKPKLKLNFTDFWPGFLITDNPFYDVLKGYYDIEISESPDFLICSVYGEAYKNYNCIRILYIGENVRPDFYEFDYSFSFDYLDTKKNYRLPLYALYCDDSGRIITQLTQPKPSFEAILAEKTKFCNMVVSNPNAPERINVFYKLSKYKNVDSGGKYLNNIGGPAADKLAFIKQYKFTIAFENSSYPGYTTEKLVEPMHVHSIPIYWGNPLVHRDFNSKSFINVHDYEDEDAVIEKIIKIDNDINLYRELLDQPYFVDNKINPDFDDENSLRQFQYIFSQGHIRPVARSFKRHCRNQYLGRIYQHIPERLKPAVKRTGYFIFNNVDSLLK